ncbi:hypothetical protein PST407_00955 [Pseudomonas syringae pv. tomato]|uniref:Uncharacterized protein n=3 Tax=Pseudomonas syringae group TaxID=136849 RepID=A0A3M5U5H9_9PSED|nr:Unknown protein sequence [Pseudomonas syringae pv. maculicola]KUR39467.1 hypothetical protein PSTA9_04962 [Pseudomonas syringae pv. tomato]RMO92825.1 hypothetical protein ALQ32_03698 [Pseudomonas syringae pv. tagetis]RMP34041.1 hypothetical protein ALQ24_01636 [Pseudomonas syringae pv. antirrhini]RMU40794.1 hypothetical protein ALP32_102763 [Pseudomonas avellanae]
MILLKKIYMSLKATIINLERQDQMETRMDLAKAPGTVLVVVLVA